MASVIQLGTAYLVGGLTFIPLVLILIVCHAVFLLPKKDAAPISQGYTIFNSDDEDVDTQLDEKLQSGSHEPSVASGYFAVTREYVPGGVNGKPPAKTSPAGESIASESPSVYQSMYRSIFERNKTQVPSIEAGKAVKKAKNVFFVVLRHGHLLLFDNSEQIEVRHVVALENHTVDVYGGAADPIPEGELWIKRNCIRLSKRSSSSGVPSQANPYFLFSENCSEKEDFYHALLFNQRVSANNSADEVPEPQPFETDDMIKLIRQVHVSDDSVHTRWINALIGRIFLALYKTSEIEEYVRNKLTKKLARASKPNFITSLRLDHIDIGHSAPIFSNAKLKSLSVDGDLTLETDVKYTGNFKVVVAAVARLDLGPRFKAREATLVLACIVKKIEGRLLVRVKPPPSNRVWMAFETLPKIDLAVEPIVSSRQITYSVVLRAIESKIRELISESLVFPNWDDSPFLHTERQRYRGGIWTAAAREHPKLEPDIIAIGEAADAEAKRTSKSGSADHSANSKQDEEDSVTISEPQDTPSRVKSFPVDIPQTSSPTTTSSPLSGSPSRFTFPEKPMAMRSHSFATAASPIVSKGPATIDAGKRPRSRKGYQDAASKMKVLSNRSPEPSPTVSPVGSPPTSTADIKRRTSSNASIPGFPDLDNVDSQSPDNDIEAHQTHSRNSSLNDLGEDDGASVISRASTSLSTRSLRSAQLEEKKAAVNQSISSATAAAKAWGIGVWNRQHERKKSGNEPMGRGRPLPPPGQPLPGPSTWSSTGATLGSLRRKPVPSLRSSQNDAMTSPGDTVAFAPSEVETVPTAAESTQLVLEDPPRRTQKPIATDDIFSEDQKELEVESLVAVEHSPAIARHGANEVITELPLPAQRSKSADDEHDTYMTYEEEEKLWDPEAMNASG